MSSSFALSRSIRSSPTLLGSVITDSSLFLMHIMIDLSRFWYLAPVILCNNFNHLESCALLGLNLIDIMDFENSENSWSHSFTRSPQSKDAISNFSGTFSVFLRKLNNPFDVFADVQGVHWIGARWIREREFALLLHYLALSSLVWGIFSFDIRLKLYSP